jgi:hypothetical protein
VSSEWEKVCKPVGDTEEEGSSEGRERQREKEVETVEDIEVWERQWKKTGTPAEGSSVVEDHERAGPVAEDHERAGPVAEKYNFRSANQALLLR